MSNWPLDYLGKSWEIGCHGPDSFDCWGLLADIYEKHKDITLSRYNEVNKLNKLDIADTIRNSISIDWESLEKPVDLCAVGLSNLPNRIFHVGCYIEKDSGYVIHTRRNFGCMIEPLDKIILTWKYITFYGLR